MRCKACDNELKPSEGKWDAKKKRFEDLCHDCLGDVMEAIVYIDEAVADFKAPVLRPNTKKAR